MKSSSNNNRSKEIKNTAAVVNSGKQILTVQSRKVFPQSIADNDDTQASENIMDQMEAPYSFCNSIKVINDADSSSQQNSVQSHSNQHHTNQNSKAYLESQIFKKWLSQTQLKEDIETYLSRKYMQFRKYKFNIYILQRSALKIQHWFFKIKYNLLQKQNQLLIQQEMLERERLSFLKAEQLVNDLINIQNSHFTKNQSPEEPKSSKMKQQAKSIDSKPLKSKGKQQLINNINKTLVLQDKSKASKQNQSQVQEQKTTHSKIQQSKTPLKSRQSYQRHTSQKGTSVFGYNQQSKKILNSNDILMNVRTNQNILQKSLEKLLERKQSPRQRLDDSVLEKSTDKSPSHFPLRCKKKQSQVVEIDLNQQLANINIGFSIQNRNNIFMTKQPSSQMIQQQQQASEKKLVEYLDLSSPSPIKFEQQPTEQGISPFIKLQNCEDQTSMNDSLVHIKDSNYQSEDELLEKNQIKIEQNDIQQQCFEDNIIQSPDQRTIKRSQELIKSHASVSKQLMRHKRSQDGSANHRSVSNPRDLFMRKSTINDTTIKNPPQFKILKINLPQKHNFQNSANRQTQSNLRGSITSLNDFSQTINPRNRLSDRKSSLSSSFILPQASLILSHIESEIIDQTHTKQNNNTSILDSASRKNNYLKSIQHKYLSKSKQKQQILNRSLDFSFTSMSQTLANKNADDTRSNQGENDATSPFCKSQKHRKSQERLERSVSMLNQKFEDQYIERLGNMKITNEKFIQDQTQ